jgi:hypothetical protein
VQRTAGLAACEEPFVAWVVAAIAQFKPQYADLSQTSNAPSRFGSTWSTAMRRSSLPSVLALSILTCGSAWSQSGETPLFGTPQEAIWRIQEFDLHFRGAGGRYHSCAALHQKIRGIMEAIGAGGVSVSISCSREALVNHALARVATAMPIAATPENIRAATTFTTESALVARLRGRSLPTPATIERFPAEWRTIEVKRIHGVWLTPEDCDLLQDMDEQIFTRMDFVRIVNKGFGCRGRTRPTLIVEALVRREA